MSEHAKLSPSAAHRWMVCPGSVALTYELPPEQRDKTSVYAEEGTLAHALLEHMLLHRGDLPETGTYSEEMIDYIQQVVDYVRETCAGREVTLYVEERVHVFPDVWGTADVIMWDSENGHLEVLDLKYGKGVAVDVVNNEQLMIYAIGAIKTFGFKPDNVTLTIAQPRVRDKPSNWDITMRDLHDWFETKLKPARELIHQGSRALCPDEDACQWCPAIVSCPEMQRLAHETALKEFEVKVVPDDLPRLGKLMQTADLLDKWISAVRKEADRVVFEAGVDIPGWKIVEGRSVRKWGNEQEAARAMIDAGMAEEEVWLRSIVGITAAEKALKKLGKPVASRVLGEYAVKPPGKLTLAPAKDPRPAVERRTAEQDFGVDEE